MDKCVGMLVSMSLLGGSAENAVDLGSTIQELLFNVYKEIQESPDPDSLVERRMEVLNPENGNGIFTVHRTTLSNIIPDADRAQLDKVLEKQAVDCLEELKGTNFKKKCSLKAIDDTSMVSHTKFKNANQSYIHVGQKSTWERGLIFPANYDASHQLFTGLIHRDNRLNDDKKKEVRPWLQRVFEKCEAGRMARVNTGFVAGDRYYFTGEFFAAASLGMLGPGPVPGSFARAIVPQAFKKNKDKLKWEFLTSDESKEVVIDYIGFNPYTHPGLRRQCEDIFERNKNSIFQIPFARVAVVDGYSKKRNRTMDELKVEARRYEPGLKERENAMESQISKYQGYFLSVKGKNIGRPALGKGRRRTKFLDNKDKKLYKACFKAHDDVKRWKKRKTALLNSLMFFAISLEPGEDPAANSELFIELARLYHERWCIENGFRDVKQYFLALSRSRRPVRRSFFLVVAMMMYNRWQVERRRVATSLGIALPDEDVEPGSPGALQRQKIEKECPGLPTAVGFLLSCWQEIILSMLKKI
ncbi:MAG: transposase [Planctomycetota bacterium]|jgi:hypothetical protein